MARTEPASRWASVLSDPEEPDWQRPTPTRRQLLRDVWLAVGIAAVSVLTYSLAESFSEFPTSQPRWMAYLAVTLIAAPLAVRRRFPIVGLVLATGVFVWSFYAVLHVSVQLFFQIAYFTSLYSMVAWGRSRQLVTVSVVVLAIFVLGWLTVDWTIKGAYSEVLEDVEDDSGLFSPAAGLAGYSAISNAVYFGGAVVMGRSSWRRALDRRRLREQAWRIAQQSEQLANRAVVEERLRIARELHDVVAHHVSAIGVQAGAARSVLGKNPEAAAAALGTVEDSSRRAVNEMRELLGVLRSEDGQVVLDHSRTPEPRLDRLEELVASHAHNGLAITLDTSLEHPDDLDTLPGSLQLTVYRCVQEALVNVTRHSTAQQATVVLRTGTSEPGDEGDQPRSWVELEVTDRGRPKAGGEGSGFGVEGLTERARLYGGLAEIGPRQPGPGWRVRIRLPRPATHSPQEARP